MSEVETPTTERQQQIAGLRELADFFETHPNIEMCAQRYLVYLLTTEGLAEIARSSSWEKVYEGDYFTLRKTFAGGIELDVYTGRENVCRKVVVGERVIPAQPATDERVEPIEEWICEEASLLGGAE